MLNKIKDIVGNIFHTDEKEKAEEKKKTSNLQQKTNNVFGLNPFLNKNGELTNPNIDYKRLLDNSRVSSNTKAQISTATGIKSNAIGLKPSATVASKGNTIANAAQKYIGTPYVWGGESMAEGGMDCSGFVYNALRDAGYDVGRTTAQGYRSYGKSVSKANMQPGDLIFFGKSNNNATHIGIYLGNGKMIHSSGGSKNTKSNPGKGVNIANVNHRSDFIEARRY